MRGENGLGSPGLGKGGCDDRTPGGLGVGIIDRESKKTDRKRGSISPELGGGGCRGKEHGQTRSLDSYSSEHANREGGGNGEKKD